MVDLKANATTPKGGKKAQQGIPKKGECYDCGKEGHFTKDCRSAEKAAVATGPAHPKGKAKEVSAATVAVSHEMMSWTACYNDTCQTHLSEKNGAGYWP